MYIVGFNGPPRSGKDTMARFLTEHMESQGCDIPIREVSLSTPLRRTAMALGGWYGVLDGHNYEAFKLETFPLMGGITGRQLMIDVSEKFLKPTYGIDVMVKLLLQDLGNFTGLVLVRDSGFQCEIDPLIEAVGSKNLYIAQVHRDGCDFHNDSREWVNHTRQSSFSNNGTLDDLRVEAGRLYGRLVNQMGWTLS